MRACSTPTSGTNPRASGLGGMTTIPASVCARFVRTHWGRAQGIALADALHLQRQYYCFNWL